MAIYRLLKNCAFGPEEIKVLTTAYEDALHTLQLADRADPATERRRSSSLHSAASAIRSDCASARLNRCRNRCLGLQRTRPGRKKAVSTVFLMPLGHQRGAGENALLARAGVADNVAERVLGHAIPPASRVSNSHNYVDEKAEPLARVAQLIEQIVNPPTGPTWWP
jgi:hypothetical protein